MIALISVTASQAKAFGSVGKNVRELTKRRIPMKFRIGCVVVGFLLFILSIAAQTASSDSAVVPPLVNFKGVLTSANGKPLTGTVGVTFYLYQDQQGGAPLWLETQNVQPDKTGHYSVALGSSSTQGLPAIVFASGEARWLGVQAQGQEEQPRVLLMSVPYALKALDAQTIGGKPASAFMLAPTGSSSSKAANLPPGTITGSGTADYVPVFTGATTIGNSKIFQTVGGDVGIGTTTPAAVLDVKGTGDVRDTLTLFPKSTHNALSVHGTAFDISSAGLVTFVSGQTFPGTGTVTSVGGGAGLTGGPITTSGSLSIKTGGVTNAMLANSSLTVTANGPLTGGGAVPLGGSTSLSLKSCSTNQILQFISGAWACANPATGTVTSVGSGLGLSGGPITGSGTLTINTSVVPQLAAANTFTANQTVNATLFANSSASAVIGTSTSSVLAAVAGGGPKVGVYGSATGTSGSGVEGQSPYNGVLGTASGSSNTSTLFGGSPGVWGDTGGKAESGFVGVVGTADDNSAGNFFNNSPQATLFVGNNSTANSTDLVLVAKGDNTGGLCTIDVSGNLTCNGTIKGSAKVDGGARNVAVYAMQSPENWFEDAGSAQLSNGSARIELDPTFAQTVNAGVEYHVFLTPKGDSEGLYVSKETPQGFEVHEQRGGHSNIAFDYRIMAKRVGYEKVRLADLTEQLNKQEAQSPKMRRSVRPSAVPKATLKVSTPPVLPVRAAVQPLAVQPK
jgi:hypothetical protein